MKKILTLLLPLQLLAHYGKAQVFAEPFIGWQTDLNGNQFKQLNTGLQLSLKKSSSYELILQLQKSWPIKMVSRDSAFTTNSSLPLYAEAGKTIKPAMSSVALGHRIAVAGKKTDNVLFIIINTGITYQRIEVNYGYDKSNYTILNPDKTQAVTGLYLSGGVEYMRLIKNGRLFFQLSLAPAPLGKEMNYPSSFHFIAPLAFNAGYSFTIKKNQHEK